MRGYYTDRLSARSLLRCYEIAPQRVRQYLETELDHVVQKILRHYVVLELGCGYGRILPRLASKAACAIGIDTSLSSLLLAQEIPYAGSHCFLVNGDAARLPFQGKAFDIVACIQNGISAFHVNQKELIREGIRVTKPGGTLLFSTYSDKFWEQRLEWFQLQSEYGLIGEIDPRKTGDGVIVCKDGFVATTVRPDRFLSLIEEFNVDTEIVEVDESSIFYEVVLLDR
jgi:2-polyprenyl-6-hydroxyphenyl methylase/3-demethylubiquinone-9 3-methyltransferase